MAHWSDTLAVFDTETTGLDTRGSRIVTAYVGLIDASGQVTECAEWLTNPGVMIPEAATAVHGVTNERARADGRAVRGAPARARGRGHARGGGDRGGGRVDGRGR